MSQKLRNNEGVYEELMVKINALVKEAEEELEESKKADE